MNIQQVIRELIATNQRQSEMLTSGKMQSRIYIPELAFFSDSPSGPMVRHEFFDNEDSQQAFMRVLNRVNWSFNPAPDNDKQVSVLLVNENMLEFRCDLRTTGVQLNPHSPIKPMSTGSHGMAAYVEFNTLYTSDHLISCSKELVTRTSAFIEVSRTSQLNGGIRQHPWGVLPGFSSPHPSWFNSPDVWSRSPEAGSLVFPPEIRSANMQWIMSIVDTSWAFNAIHQNWIYGHDQAIPSEYVDHLMAGGVERFDNNRHKVEVFIRTLSTRSVVQLTDGARYYGHDHIPDLFNPTRSWWPWELELMSNLGIQRDQAEKIGSIWPTHIFVFMANVPFYRGGYLIEKIREAQKIIESGKETPQ